MQGSVGLVAARAFCDASLLGTGGALAFRVAVVPRALARAAERAGLDGALSRLTALWLGASAIGLLAWTVLQSGAIAGADGLVGDVAAMRPVLVETQFGHLVLLQAALLALAAVSLRRSVRVALGVASVLLVAQAAHGHVAAMDGVASPLFAVDALHLLAASGWVGGLVPLLLVVRLGTPRTGAMAARWFSPFGKACVVLLAGSAVVQGWVLVGSLRALRSTPYGWMVLVKTALFAVLLGFALLNRHRLAPALLAAHPGRARRRLLGAIAVQTLAGLAAIAAAAMLSSLEPGMDMGQPR